MKSGFVSLIGRPNAGKSTLVNEIVGRKVAITSNKPQTTRNIIKGIYNDDDSQIVFIDTPGIHKPNNKLGNVLNKQAFYGINDADIILLLVDASESLGGGDKFIIDKLKSIDMSFVIVSKEEELLVYQKDAEVYKSFLNLAGKSYDKYSKEEYLVSKIRKAFQNNSDCFEELDKYLDKFL